MYGHIPSQEILHSSEYWSSSWCCPSEHFSDLDWKDYQDKMTESRKITQLRKTGFTAIPLYCVKCKNKDTCSIITQGIEWCPFKDGE